MMRRSHRHASRLARHLHLALRRWATAAPLAGCMLAIGATGAYAQQQARHYDIPAGPLATTLHRLGTEAGLLLSFSAEQTAGRHSPGVRGELTTAEALAAALAGTGLEAVVQGNGYRLRALPTTTLAPVSVAAASTATRDAAATEHSSAYTATTMRTATGFDLAPRDTPQSVSVVTRQQMDDQGLTDLAGVLARSTGISLNASETDRVSATSRGFNINKIQYDGMATVEDGGFDSDWLADAAIYDRVEIVRGATGLLTGTGEPSAAINLVRKRPTDTFQGQAQLSAGSWDAYRGEIDVGGPLTAQGHVRGRLVAVYGDRKSSLDHYRKDLGRLYGIVEIDLPSDTLLTIGLDYQRRHTNGVTYGASVPLFYADGSPTHFARSTSTSADWTYLDRDRLVGFASLEKTFANGWQARVQYSHQNGDMAVRVMGMEGFPDRLTGDGVGTWYNDYDHRNRQNALSMQASGPFALFGREHELVFGYTDNEQRYDAKYRTAIDDTPLTNFHARQQHPAPRFGDDYSHFADEVRREDAVYLATRWHLATPFKLIAGLRLTNFDYRMHWRGNPTTARYSGELTPYAGIVYDLSEHYTAYASYTDIFQTQTVRDRDNKILDPKTGTHYEAGLKGAFHDGQINVSAAVFRIEQDNLSEFDAIVDGEYRYKAVKGATVRGYELDVSGSPLPAWNLSAGFTRRIAKDNAGSAIQTTEPQNLLRLTSAHTLPGALNDVTVGGHLTWQSRILAKGKRPGGGDAVQDSYALVHLFGIYRASKQLSFQANINNLFDKVYYTSVNSYGKYGDPRNITVSMKYRF